MVDLRTATQHLVLGGGTHPLPADTLSMELLDGLDGGVVHADYGDPGHVFRVTITQVPRVRADFNAVTIGRVDVAGIGEVQVVLVQLMLANHVSVVLHGRRAVAGPGGRQRPDADLAPAAGAPVGDGDPAMSAQQWVEQRIVERLQGLRVLVGDDVGTSYGPRSGEGGAEGTTTSIERYLPLPPSGATRLSIAILDDRAVVGSHEVVLPSPR